LAQPLHLLLDGFTVSINDGVDALLSELSHYYRARGYPERAVAAASASRGKGSRFE
jgi:hypothetical protein